MRFTPIEPRRPALLLLLTIGTASAWELREAHHPLPELPAALIVASPGADPGEYSELATELEAWGFDAVMAVPEASLGSVESATASLSALGRELKETRGEYQVAAHGYGGTLALMAGLEAERFALIGSPIGPHLVPPDFLSNPGDDNPLFEAPNESLRRELISWAGDMPDVPDPGVPVLLIASDADAVAPPECVRLPSRGWSERRWSRFGMLHNQRTGHLELRSSTAAAVELTRFLKER